MYTSIFFKKNQPLLKIMLLFKEGLIHNYVLVVRELVGGVKSYAAIIDYYYNLDEVPKDVNIFLENVDEVLSEMEEMNKLL